MSEPMVSSPGYVTAEHVLVALDRSHDATIQNILNEVLRAVLYQASLADWPRHVRAAILALAEEHHDPQRFLHDLVLQLQNAIADETPMSWMCSPAPVGSDVCVQR